MLFILFKTHHLKCFLCAISHHAIVTLEHLLNVEKMLILGAYLFIYAFTFLLTIIPECKNSKVTPEEWVFVESAFNTKCYIVKNTLLHADCSAILGCNNLPVLVWKIGIILEGEIWLAYFRICSEITRNHRDENRWRNLKLCKRYLVLEIKKHICRGFAVVLLE